MTTVDPKILVNLSANLKSSAFCRSFVHDPVNTLDRAGLRWTELPPEAVDNLSSLSPEELTSLSAGELAARLGVQIPDEPVVDPTPEALADILDGVAARIREEIDEANLQDQIIDLSEPGAAWYIAYST